MIISDNIMILEQKWKNDVSVYSPYTGLNNILTRKLLSYALKYNLKGLKKVFRNKSIIKSSDDFIIVFDSRMSKDFLEWIVEKKTSARLVFWYWNPIRKSIPIEDIPCEYEIWTYSKTEAEIYNIKFHEQFFLESEYEKRIENNKSIFFIGKDKGRLEELRKIEKYLKKNNIYTNFIYVANRRKIFNNNDGIRNKVIPYKEVQKLCSECDTVFDYCAEKQDGLSLRPLEALYYKKKLITNNQSILEASFYDPKWIFVIGHDPFDKIVDFCNQQNIDRLSKSVDCYSIEQWYKDLKGL